MIRRSGYDDEFGGTFRENTLNSKLVLQIPRENGYTVARFDISPGRFRIFPIERSPIYFISPKQERRWRSAVEFTRNTTHYIFECSEFVVSCSEFVVDL